MAENKKRQASEPIVNNEDEASAKRFKVEATKKKLAPANSAIDDTATLADVFKDDNPAPAPAVVLPQPRSPPNVAQAVVRSPFTIYADMYDEFDPNNIEFSKDPQASREGGGQMVFMLYRYKIKPADGQGEPKFMSKPLLVQTPNSIFLPAGVTVWKDGKASMLLSLGRDWENNALYVKFRALLDSIQNRICQMVISKEWNNPQPNTMEAIVPQMTGIMTSDTDAKGEPYPPSMKASVIVSGKDASEFYEFAPKPPLPALTIGDVAPKSTATTILNFPWVYRKKDKKLWRFSARVNAFQSIIEPASRNVSGLGNTQGSCNVVM
jgi:hypothetical protein